MLSLERAPVGPFVDTADRVGKLFPETAAEQRGTLAPEHAFGARVDVGDPPLHVERHEGVARVLQRAGYPIPRLAKRCGVERHADQWLARPSGPGSNRPRLSTQRHDTVSPANAVLGA